MVEKTGQGLAGFGSRFRGKCPSKSRQTLPTPGLFLGTLSRLVWVLAFGFFQRGCFFFVYSFCLVYCFFCMIFYYSSVFFNQSIPGYGSHVCAYHSTHFAANSRSFMVHFKGKTDCPSLGSMGASSSESKSAGSKQLQAVSVSASQICRKIKSGEDSMIKYPSSLYSSGDIITL